VVVELYGKPIYHLFTKLPTQSSLIQIWVANDSAGIGDIGKLSRLNVESACHMGAALRRLQ